MLLTYEELAAKTLDKLPNKTTNPHKDADDDDSKDVSRRNGSYGDELRELIEAASQESRKGVGWGMDRLVVLGRKPKPSARFEAAGVVGGESGEKKSADGKTIDLAERNPDDGFHNHGDDIIIATKKDSASAVPALNVFSSEPLPPSNTTTAIVAPTTITKTTTITTPEAYQIAQPPPTAEKKPPGKRGSILRTWMKRMRLSSTS